MNRNLKYILVVCIIVGFASYLIHLHYLDKPLKKLALDENCLPEGYKARHQAKNHYESFWEGQKIFIKDDWKSYKQIIELAQVEKDRERMNEEFDKKAQKALGIDDDFWEPKEYQEMYKLKQELERDEKIKEQKDVLERAEWTKRCLKIASLHSKK